MLASLAMLARESALRVAGGGSAPPPSLFVALRGWSAQGDGARCATWMPGCTARPELAASGILLAVAQKRIVAQIEAIGPLPRNVEWLHHSGPTCRGLAAAV